MGAGLVPGGRSPLLGDRWRRGAGGKGSPLNLVYSDAYRLARSRELEPVLDAFEIDLRHQVAAIAPRRVFVHAGVAA
jgi:hypothetical protein